MCNKSWVILVYLFIRARGPGHHISAAASGWTGWALAHPEFERSVNPITSRGADYAHHITASPPGFETPAAALIIYSLSLFFSYYELLDSFFAILNYHQNSKLSQDSYLLYLAVDFIQSFVSFDLSPVPSFCKMGHKLTE